MLEFGNSMTSHETSMVFSKCEVYFTAAPAMGLASLIYRVRIPQWTHHQASNHRQHSVQLRFDTAKWQTLQRDKPYKRMLGKLISVSP